MSGSGFTESGSKHFASNQIFYNKKEDVQAPVLWRNFFIFTLFLEGQLWPALILNRISNPSPNPLTRFNPDPKHCLCHL
jgi:hypothetical protein